VDLKFGLFLRLTLLFSNLPLKRNVLVKGYWFFQVDIFSFLITKFLHNNCIRSSRHGGSGSDFYCFTIFQIILDVYPAPISSLVLSATGSDLTAWEVFSAMTAYTSIVARLNGNKSIKLQCPG
jgi:hypothetical protein